MQARHTQHPAPPLSAGGDQHTCSHALSHKHTLTSARLFHLSILMNAKKKKRKKREKNIPPISRDLELR